MNTIIRICFFLFLLLFSIIQNAIAQCCAGGSGSPIAGGASQGVLMHNQLEINSNFQFINTNQFFHNDKKDTALYFDRFTSNYQYLRIAAGLSDKLTFSLESGYYFQKKEWGRNGNTNNTYSASGPGDLILFPRYQIFNHCSDYGNDELSLGIGFKIPLGSCDDSTARIEEFSGTTYYVRKPQAVQLSSGSHDFIFQSFYSHSFTKMNFKLFASALYIKKGWNKSGEKLGDFASLSLFASKSFLRYWGLTMQLKSEIVERMTLNPDILMYAYPNYDPVATGYKKVFVSPQITFTRQGLSLFAIADIPIYQYVNETQIGSEFQITCGFSWRFMLRKPSLASDGNAYVCPMHPEISSDSPSTCSKCRMKLEKRK